MLNRRHLFGLFGAGAAVAALPKVPTAWLAPEAITPSVTITAAASVGTGKNTLLTLQTS